MAVASRARSGPPVGAVPSTCVVSDNVEELYDYDAVRRLNEPTMFEIRLVQPTLVLGSSQSLDVLDRQRTSSMEMRRRRGGGGIVLLQPGDLWVDWWIPHGDARWSNDVHASSIRAGQWWREALSNYVNEELHVHEGSLEGDPALRVVCFAGRGPGEIFEGGKKVLGVTQWRVREGTFVSTVVHAHSSALVADLLREPVPGISEALAHHTISTLGIEEPESLRRDLAAVSGPWH